MKKQTTELGKVITEAREKKGISSDVAAGLIGVSGSGLCTIESGKYYPRLTTLIGLMELYDCTFEDLCRNMDRR